MPLVSEKEEIGALTKIKPAEWAGISIGLLLVIYGFGSIAVTLAQLRGWL